MSLEKRIERLERRRGVSEGQRVKYFVICPNKEPSPTDEETKVARAEFIEKYGDSSLMNIDFIKGLTFASVNGEYVELPHSDRLRQLRQKRIDSQGG